MITKDAKPLLSTEWHHLLLQAVRLAAAIVTGMVLMLGFIFAMNALHMPMQFKGLNVTDLSIAVIAILGVVSGLLVYSRTGGWMARRFPARCHYCAGPAYFQDRLVPGYRCRSCGGTSPVEKPRKRRAPKKTKEASVEFGADSLVITGYELEHASVFSKPEVRAQDMSAVFRSLEVAFVLNGREVIFLPYAYKDEFNAFVQRNNISHMTDKVEFWSVLLEPFLDTEYTDSDREGGYRVLEENGFSRTETDAIRKRVRLVMFEATCKSWEWRYYSTWDVLWAMKALHPRQFTAEFYWWVMEIALRTCRADGDASLMARFITAWKVLSGKGDPVAVFDRLAAAYSVPTRFYHTLDHIKACLRELDQVRQHADHPDRVEMAIWFHDAVYDVWSHASTGPDNEEKSAEMAGKELQDGGLSEPLVSYTRDLILATRHDAAPHSRDAQLIVDIDLAVLGKSEAEFDEYDRKIGQEYSHVPSELYRLGRIKILRRLLERKSIYQTPSFRERCEAAARQNLERLITKLETSANR